MSKIGLSIERIDALSKVTGKALYPGDIKMPDQLYMKIRFSDHVHAIIKSIDTSVSEALPGVVAILTAKDVPVNEYGLIMPDQPVLCGPGSEKPYADRVRFVGDQVALVVAETEEAATKGAAAIKIEYELLPVVSDIKSAMAEDSLLIHPEKDSNVILAYKIIHGDVEAGFAKADVIVEGEYHTPAQEHAYLQPEAGLGYIDEEGRVTVVVAGQWAHDDRKQIAHSLGLPEEQVRVIYPAIGGAFGGREDMSVQIVLGLAAWRLSQRGINRPVKIVWSREESIIGHHKRHPYSLRAKWGATKDGKIVAAEMDVTADGGAYAYTSTKVLGNATLACTGPYEIPNAKVNTRVVYTNNIPGGAFRGFGGPQGSFAAEQQINKIAEALGMDPVDIRLKNAITDDSILTVGSRPPKGVTMVETIKACKKVLDDLPATASSSANKKRGVGFASAYKNVGFSYGAPEQCFAKIELKGREKIEEVVVYHAASEVGQGTHTAIKQMAAEALNVPLEIVRMEMSDTATSSNSGSVSASRMTFMSGNSIRGAAEAALKKWNEEEERPAIAEYKYVPPKTYPLSPVDGSSAAPNFSYGYVAEAAVLEVDVETGHIEIVDLVCANDVGKAINRAEVEGQIQGAVVQASGYTILENFVQDEGIVKTSQFSTYLIPTVLDIPARVHAEILEYADPNGPWGARGMAEMPYIPLAPAITAAVHDAIGVWIDEFPLTPERILKALGKLNV